MNDILIIVGAVLVVVGLAAVYIHVEYRAQQKMRYSRRRNRRHEALIDSVQTPVDDYISVFEQPEDRL